MKTSKAKKISKIYDAKYMNGWSIDEATKAFIFQPSNSAHVRFGYFSGYPLKMIPNFDYETLDKCTMVMPEDSYQPKHEFKMPVDNFLLGYGFMEALKDCLSLLSEKSPRNYGQVININWEKDGSEGMTMVSTDAFALIERKLYAYTDNLNICLGIREAKLLCEIFDEGKTALTRKIIRAAISEDKAYMYFCQGNVGTSDYILACVRLSNINYPRYKNVLPDKTPMLTFKAPQVKGIKEAYTKFGSNYMKAMYQDKKDRKLYVSKNISSDVILPNEVTVQTRYLKLAGDCMGEYIDQDYPINFMGKTKGNPRRLLIVPVTA